MKQTLHKAFSIGGIRSMTGPAVRNDQRVIDVQLDLLSHYPETLELYQFFTHRIKKSKIDSTDI